MKFIILTTFEYSSGLLSIFLLLCNSSLEPFISIKYFFLLSPPVLDNCLSTFSMILTTLDTSHDCLGISLVESQSICPFVTGLFHYPLISWWTFGLLPTFWHLWVIMNMDVQIPLPDLVLNPFGYIPRSGIAGLLDHQRHTIVTISPHLCSLPAHVIPPPFYFILKSMKCFWLAFLLWFV